MISHYHPLSYDIQNTHQVFISDPHQTTISSPLRNPQIYSLPSNYTQIFPYFHHLSNECRFFMRLYGISHELKIDDCKEAKLMEETTCLLIPMPLFKVKLMFLV